MVMERLFGILNQAMILEAWILIALSVKQTPLINRR
jgi:hypothetical protein